MVKILVADPVSESGLVTFENNGGHFQLSIQHKLQPDALKKAVEDVDAVIVRSETKITADVLSAGKKIKIVGRAGVGVDNIDVQAASRQGVVVVNVPGGNTISAAEHTMALLMSLSRNIPQANASMKAGEWKRPQFTGTELQGKVLGLVGMGRIGREVAKRAQSFGMIVLGYDPFASEEYARAANIQPSTLDEIYKAADFITFHVPLNDTTKHLINAETIKKLKKGVRLINCARGGIIDEQALYDAVKSGHIKGAALDVFEQEPVQKDHPLLSLPQVIMTPHLGASTEEAQVKVAQELSETIKDYFLTGTIRNAVNLPSLDAKEFQALEPFILLAEKLGRFASQMVSGATGELRLTYAGEISEKNTTPLTLAALKGFLGAILDVPVNEVNAPHLAKERGLKWVETKKSQASDYTSLLTIEAVGRQATFSVSGTLLAQNTPRIVLIDGQPLDVAPEGVMIVFSNHDKPGVIGFIGTILGKSGVNIAAMQVGRKSIGGDAITVVNVDSPVSKEILAQIKEYPGISNIRCVTL